MDRFDSAPPWGQPGRPAAEGQSPGLPVGQAAGAIIGGLPWAGSARPRDAASETSPLPVRIQEATPRSKQTQAAPPLADRVRELVARSPAFSVSLSVHVIVLLLLAVWVIRREVTTKPVITLSFAASARPVVRPAPESVEIARTPEPPAPTPPKKPEPVPQPVPRPTNPVEKVPDPAPTPVAAIPSDTPSTTVGVARKPITSQLAGRGDAARGELVGASGGTEGTENAVARALGWLVKNSGKSDGLWSLMGPYADGGSQENKLAATAMALLALQGAGTTASRGRHSAVVDRAWRTLLKRQRPDGTFELGTIPDQHQMYAHAQITIALCEAFGMTGDERFGEPARRAVRYSLAAQMPDGGWRYRPPEPNHENKGDMSVTGWFLMALKTAEMAGLEVPSENYTRLESFLDNVFISDEKGYAYQINPHQKAVDFRAAITAEGLLCRQYLGWSRTDPRLMSGMKLLLESSPLDFGHQTKNVYAWYYQTQVFHHAGGEAWEAWNGHLRERLPAEQVKSGREAGSWDRANDQWGHIGGRLYVTCLCTLMLESYYRHLPIYD